MISKYYFLYFHMKFHLSHVLTSLGCREERKFPEFLDDSWQKFNLAQRTEWWRWRQWENRFLWQLETWRLPIQRQESPRILSQNRRVWWQYFLTSWQIISDDIVNTQSVWTYCTPKHPPFLHLCIYVFLTSLSPNRDQGLKSWIT